MNTRFFLLFPSLVLACNPGVEPKDDSAETGGVDTEDSLGDSDDSGDSGDTGSQGCVPNGDGRIDFAEFIADPSLGFSATVTVNEAGSTVTVPDPDGVDDGTGGRNWDFTAPTPEDRTWTLGLQEPSGFWFAEHFPTATYTVPLDASAETWGLYRVDAASEKLLLLGMASAVEDYTLLVYAEPIVVFEFPLRTDRSWASVEVEATGSWEGTSYPIDYGYLGVVSLKHTYRMEVDLSGSASVPLGRFDVLRIKLEQSFEAVNSLSGPFAENTLLSYFYVTECTGLVARVRSRPNETDPDFKLASEYLRLGF